MLKLEDNEPVGCAMINPDRLVNTFIELLEINSPALAEEGVAHYLKKELLSLGLGLVEDSAGATVQGRTNNLLFIYRPHGVERYIHFNAHMDTVAPTPNIQIIKEGGMVRTDGTTILGADDKAGIAIMVEVAKVLKETGFTGCGVEFLFLVAEEIGLKGARAFDTGLLKAEFGYSLDSSGPIGMIVNEAPYHDVLDIELVGRAAHAGIEPEKGISAIVMAAQAISKLPWGRLDDETTANIGIIQGGLATNIITERVCVKGEARSRNKEKINQLSTLMRETFETTAQQMGGSCKVIVERHYSGYKLKEESLVIQTARKAAQNIGLVPLLKPTGGGSDANIFNEKGFPCAVLGLNYRGAHTPQEHIAVEDLVKAAEYVLAIIKEFAK